MLKGLDYWRVGLVFLGAIVLNVTIALLCALFSPYLFDYSREPSAAEIEWVRGGSEKIAGDDAVVVEGGIGWLRKRVYLEDPQFEESMQAEFGATIRGTFSVSYPRVERLSIGVPLRCFEGKFWVHSRQWIRSRADVVEQVSDFESKGLLRIGVWHHGAADGIGFVPYAPVWYSMLFNVLAYSLILWAAASGLRRVRTKLLMRRGRCARCGYLLRQGHSGTCPECGTTVSAR